MGIQICITKVEQLLRDDHIPVPFGPSRTNPDFVRRSHVHPAEPSFEMKPAQLLVCLYAASLCSTTWGGLIEVVGTPESLRWDELAGNALANKDSLTSGNSIGDNPTANEAVGSAADTAEDPQFRSDAMAVEPGVDPSLGTLTLIEHSTPFCYTTSARHVTINDGSRIDSSYLGLPFADPRTIERGNATSVIGQFLPKMAESFETLSMPPHEEWSRKRWMPEKKP